MADNTGMVVAAPLASPHAISELQLQTTSQPSKKKDVPNASISSGVSRRKQSKSRNGCITCKAKRLKCDEVKPTCQQCTRRDVVCGGYRKDFKWRPFEEPGCVGKPLARPQKHSRQVATNSAQAGGNHVSDTHQPYHSEPLAAHQQLQATLSQQVIAVVRNIANDCSASQLPQSMADRTHPSSISSRCIIIPPPVTPVQHHTPACPGPDKTNEQGAVKAAPIEITTPLSVAAGLSHRVVDLLLSGADHCVPAEEYLPWENQHRLFYQPTGINPSGETDFKNRELIARKPDFESRTWPSQISAPISSQTLTGTSFPSRISQNRIPMQIQDTFSSSESISRLFHQDTCGVLSVKNGPTENPWRTLVWPLARDCPALYHAIASMTSFHRSTQFPPMWIQGIDHMQTAIQALAEGLQNMRFDAAISTTLVLAFAESWDVQISTGINHIKAAKVLIKRALVQHRTKPKQDEELTRLQFLCNTWIYMDVIARLTSTDDDDSNDMDPIYESIRATCQIDTALDPLMGCAHALFPIIGRVASLIRRLRRSGRHDSDLSIQAIRLKSQLERWTPPVYIDNPEDETMSPGDSIRTATAYQYATLLHLHQAFPEVPSLPALVLAKRALCELALIEPGSRSCITHIYPLMAAGCEMVNEDDRAWVIRRWELLSSRMKLGIVDKSLIITKEVWARRDNYTAECNIHRAMRDDSMPSVHVRKRNHDEYLGSNNDDLCWFGSGPKRRATDSDAQGRPPSLVLFPLKWRRSDGWPQGSIELLKPELIVNGRLHWLGVMREWKWEVLLG